MTSDQPMRFLMAGAILAGSSLAVLGGYLLVATCKHRRPDLQTS